MSTCPPGWEWATIGDVCTLNPPMAKADLPDDGLVSFVPMAAVSEESGNIDASDRRSAGELKRKSYRQFVDGDVLVAKITPSMENGKAAVATGLAGGRGFGSTEFHVLRPHAGIVSRYLLHYVLQPRFRAEAARHMTGTAGQLRVPVGYLAECPIPIPPTTEQERIVAAIEEHFSRLDAATGALSSALSRLRALEAALVATVLEGDWPVRKLADHTLDQKYGTSAKASTQGDVPVLRMGNIIAGALDFSDLKYLPGDHPDLAACLLQPGDLLFNRTNSPELVGKSAVFHGAEGPVAFASYLIRVRFDDRLRPDWAATFINSTAGRRYIDSVRTQQVGQANVNGTKLKAFPIAVPPPEIQHQRLEFLKSGRSWTRKVFAEVGRARRQAEWLRRAILASAFQGRLVEQDPNDEPASELLGRITSVGVPREAGREMVAP